jgi:hypothetical protein
MKPAKCGSYYYRKFSADFMQAFGNDKKTLPILDH